MGELYIKGRGAQINPANKFAKHSCEKDVEHLYSEQEKQEELSRNPNTKYIDVFPKTILNKVTSPDLGMGWSMNPYQGCEHGCIYCYARNTHEYWGYSAGAEFEQNILVKRNAPELLREALMKKNHKADSIMLSGNTDCYQPIERKLGITRKLLEVFYDMRHPVGIITKNALVQRDIDLLSEMAKLRLAKVTLSITTLDDKLKRIMEPRTAAPKAILTTLSRLANAGIPVNVNTAPIIPAINDEEIFDLVKTCAEHGATSVSYIIVRLNGHNGNIFTDWVTKNFPDRANKVLNQIKTMHGGKLNDTDYGRRMRGEGKFAELIRSQYQLACAKYLKGRQMPPTNYDLYEPRRNELLQQQNDKVQLNLFQT